MGEPAALWSAKDLPQVWDPIDLLTKVKYNVKDIENIRKYVIDHLDAQMEGSKKDEDCIRSGDINRVMRLYDRLLLFNSIEAASEKAKRDTYGKAEDENIDNKKYTGSLVIGDPNSYLVVYRLPIGALKKKEGGMLKVFVTIIEHQICHLLIFYYRPKDVKNGEQHTALHNELMRKIFGHKTQPVYLMLDFTLEKSTKPVGNITGVVQSLKTKSNQGATKIYQKTPEEAGGKSNKKSPVRSPIKSSPKKKAAAKKKSAAKKKKPSPVRSPVKTKTSPRKKSAAKKKPAAKKTKVKSPKTSNTPKKTKGKKFPKGLTLGPFRKESAARGYDKEETKELWQRYKKGEI